MNENQLKTKIYLLRALDTTLLLIVVGLGVYAAFYAENKEIMIIACLVGLFLVNALGRATNKSITLMGIQLEKLKREKKTEEQRTLMSTRHSTRFSTRSGATKSAVPTAKPKTDK
jgi:uncharacterized membrane protein (Fun14 family)